MVDTAPELVVPGGESGPAVDAVLQQMDALCTLLRRFADAAVVPEEHRETAAALADQLRDSLVERPVRVAVVAASQQDAAAWASRTASLPDVPLPTSFRVWTSEAPFMAVVRRDGARFDLEGLSPDPAPGLRKALEQGRARLRDLTTARDAVQGDLDVDLPALQERAGRKEAVEERLAAEREALAAAKGRIATLESDIPPAAAYLKACETTVPAVLRREPAGLLERWLHVLLPLLFSTDLRVWRTAVDRRTALDADIEAARVAAARCETQLVRSRRERVALMNESVRLQNDVGRCRAELAALDAELEGTGVQVDAAQSGLARWPASRRETWLEHLRAHGGLPETRFLEVAAPDLLLPAGLAVSVGPDADADVVLVLDGTDPETQPERPGRMLLVEDGARTSGGMPLGEALEAAGMRALSMGSRGLDRLRATASLASVWNLSQWLVAEMGPFLEVLTASLQEPEAEDTTVVEVLERVGSRWSDAFAEERASEFREAGANAAEQMLKDGSARVPDMFEGTWEALTQPLEDFDEPSAVAAASARLSGALQGRVDTVVQQSAGSLAQAAVAWVSEVSEAILQAEADQLVALGGDRPAAVPVGRIPLATVIPEVMVGSDAGEVGGPLVRLRTAEELREDAVRGIRSATEQATVQLQARLVGARASLARALDRQLQATLERGRGALLEAHAAARVAQAAAVSARPAQRESLRGDLALVGDHVRALMAVSADISVA